MKGLVVATYCAIALSLPAFGAEQGKMRPESIHANANSAVQVPEDMRWEPRWRDKGDCGPISLYILMRLMGETVSVEDLKAVIPFDPDVGCSLADVARGADALGFETEIRFVPRQDLTALTGPFIYHSEGSLTKGTGHFGVIAGYLAERNRFVTIDTEFESFGLVPEENVYDQYSGYVLAPKSVVGERRVRAYRVGLFALGTVFAGLVLLGRRRCAAV